MHAECWDCLIFIDALCINQEDEAEKGHQVGLMRDVYRGAESVVAWVGDHGDLLQRLETLDDEKEVWQAISRSDDGLDFLLKSETSRASSIVTTLEHLIDTFFGNLHAAAETPPDFQHDNLGALLVEMVHRHQNGCYPWLVLTRRVLAQRYKFLIGRGYLHLGQALILFRGQECSIIHDKVFGLLGLTDSPLDPHYNMTIMDLYAWALIEATLQLSNRLHRSPTASVGEDSEDSDGILGLVASLMAVAHALDVRPFHPSVALINSLVLELCNARGFADLPILREWLAELWVEFRLFDRLNWTKWVPARGAAIKGVARIWTASARWRLKYYKQRNAMLPTYKGASAKTYSEWTEAVEEIFRTVKSRMDAAQTTEARMEKPRKKKARKRKAIVEQPGSRRHSVPDIALMRTQTTPLQPKETHRALMRRAWTI